MGKDSQLGYFLLLSMCGYFGVYAGCPVGQYTSEGECKSCFPQVPWRPHKCRNLCTNGYPVRRCDGICRYLCLKEICQIFIKTCVLGCAKGWYGDDCEKRCGNGCVQDKCDRSSGNCQCRPGYFNDGRCLSCANGRYGSLCVKTCDNCRSGLCDLDGNCQSSICDTDGNCANGCDSGSCISDKCKHSLANQTCKHACIDGWYGSKCNIQCNAECKDRICHTLNGSCRACIDTTFGYSCEKNCSSECMHGVCHQVTGVCTNGCSSSFYGSYCNLTCPSECKENVCNQKNGYCTNGCSKSFYGPYCNLTCNTECREGNCHQYTGACTDGCSAKLYGSYCNLTCSPRCTDGDCGQANGSCTKGCSKSSYGSHCNHTCSYKCLGSECKVSLAGDVTCTHGCLDGWWGSYCQQQCQKNCKACVRRSAMCVQCSRHKYGFNCSETCSERCFGQECDMTGICTEGCIHGWMGEKCQLSTLWFVLPGCLLASLLTAFVILWVCKSYGVVGCLENCQGTARDPQLGGIDNRNSAVNGCNAMDNMPLLREESYVNKSTVTTRVPLSDFQNYIKRQQLTSGLIKQFERLPINPVYPCYDGDSSRCVMKNRYGNILPYDYNRVVLEEDLAGQSCDYINASYIKGYFKNTSFVATQGPFSEVFKEFWQMIWQKDGNTIVMLTNCVENKKVKCEQYWPNLGQTHMITTNITVECLAETVEDDFTIRTFALKKDGQKSRTIKQFHFTIWPDFDVPDNLTSFLKLQSAVKISTPSHVGPVVVHCSAGVGRTGTYIALDYLINQAKAEGAVDVFKCVLQLRHQRMNLVQTEAKAVYVIYDVLLQAIDSLNDSSSTVDIHNCTDTEEVHRGTEKTDCRYNSGGIRYITQSENIRSTTSLGNVPSGIHGRRRASPQIRLP